MASIDIGKRIRQVRETTGANQREFAARLGSSSGRISEIESGKNMPGGDLLLRINQEFKTDLTWLLTGDEAKTAQRPPPAAPLSLDMPALELAVEYVRNREQLEKKSLPAAAFAKAVRLAYELTLDEQTRETKSARGRVVKTAQKTD